MYNMYNISIYIKYICNIYIYIYIYIFIGKVATVSNQRQLYSIFFKREYEIS